MPFTVRRSQPSGRDPNYINIGSGGRNHCITTYTSYTYGFPAGSVLPNCTGYAWGRFMEILGSTPKLSTGNAGRWYGNTADGYSRGSKPQLGAVACWARPGEAGHVAIVEEIKSDGSIVTSNSGYGWRSPRGPVEWITGRSPTWTSWGGYVFQGFIYNPACDGMDNKLSDFLKVAESHVGETGDWAWKTSGLSRGDPWCMAFVMACAKTVGGLINVIFPMTYSCTAFIKLAISAPYNASWYLGPRHGRNFVPEPGDLIFFRYRSILDSDTKLSDHVGIVRKVDSTTVYTVEGNAGSTNNYSSRVKYNQYSLRYSCINGYIRPDWARVGASSSNLITGNYGPLYTAENTRKDAILREVAFIRNNQLSTSSSNVYVSAMNYTYLLNSLYEIGMPSISGSVGDSSTSNVDVSNLEEIPRAIFEFLTGNGLNSAGAIGILANIQAECGFQIGVVNSIGAAGMCQWMGSRKAAMIKMAGPNWKTNLTGQCNYLWHELTTDSYYKRVAFQPIKSVDNTIDGALYATNVFLHKYEVPDTHGPGNPLSTSCSFYRTRSGYCRTLWSKLVPIVT